MANATMVKFGFPASLVHGLEHWAVLLRPAQVTLGSLVLASTSEATAYGDLPEQAYVEQGRAVAAIERALTAFARYDRINYLMLMMVDPHVHFHVIPRYAQPREWKGRTLADAGWPGQPELGRAVMLDSDAAGQLRGELESAFSAAPA